MPPTSRAKPQARRLETQWFSRPLATQAPTSASKAGKPHDSSGSKPGLRRLLTCMASTPFNSAPCVAHAEDSGEVLDRRQPCGRLGTLLQTITYAGSGTFSLADSKLRHMRRTTGSSTGISLRMQAYASKPIAHLHHPHGSPLGIRVDSDRHQSIVVRGGLGIFYDTVPLDTYAFNKYPEQTVTNYDGAGNIISGPQRYLNIISQSAETEEPLPPSARPQRQLRTLQLRLEHGS